MRVSTCRLRLAQIQIGRSFLGRVKKRAEADSVRIAPTDGIREGVLGFENNAPAKAILQHFWAHGLRDRNVIQSVLHKVDRGVQELILDDSLEAWAA